MFCGRQGVPLRGHVDAGPYTIEEPTTNEGNFRALVRFRIKDNKELQELFVNAPKHAQYLSHQIQNEIISICNDLILSNLVKKFTQAEYFSVLADETTDISCKEQLSICIRYVDSDNCLQEDFLQFIEVDGLSGESLSRAILTNLQRFGIDISKMRGQGYDGAAAMSGRLHGVQAYVREVVPTAVYVHCAAHSLNLVISRLCSVQAVRNCIGIIGAVCKFFNTPNKQAVFERAMENCTQNNPSRRNRLVQMSATRWIERRDSVMVFLQLYHPVIAALEVSSWQDRDSSTNAQQLSISVQQSQFLVALFCLNKVYNFRSDLSKALQSKSMNSVECVELATNVQEELEDMRENALLVFSEIYQEIQVVASQIDLELKKPRLVPSQRNQGNVQSETVEDYYRVSVFIPLLDCFICELKARFENHKSILQGFYSLLPKETAINGPTVVQIKNIKDLANF